MIKIGITGGIGSGKSMVAALLEVWGIPVYIADTESKHLTATSPRYPGKADYLVRQRTLYSRRFG